MIIRIHPSPVPEPLLPCGVLSEHADPFLTCKFWTCQLFFLDLQVFQQTVKQSCISLRCCLKHSLSSECFTTNVWGINIFLTEMQEKRTIQINISSIGHQCGIRISRLLFASSLRYIPTLMEHRL